MALCLTAALAMAQTGANTGLQGKVTDATGASVPKTTVTLLRTETGEQRVVTTNDAGDWEARMLSPGKYQLTFEHGGFKKLVRDGVVVTTSEVDTVNVELQVGSVGQSIEVVADAEMISSTSATTVRTLDRRELEGLPTSSRNFTQLLMIETGVDADISELLSNDNASVSPSVNGARTTNNSFVYNGVDVTNLLCCNNRISGGKGTIDEGGGSLSRNMGPAPETLEEVKLQTSLYDAATGRNGGGNFQLVSKTGTNEFHGSVYEFFQNDKLMANEFFYNRAGLERPMLRRNEGGFTLGGPIIKQKTFFFGSFQASRARTSFTDEASNILRLPKALTDDRSDEGINRFNAAVWPTNAGAVNPALINPISRALLKAKFPDGSYLIPSGANGTDCRRTAVSTQVADSCQVITVYPATYAQNQLSGNIDHQFTSANRLSGKFFFTNQPSHDPLANSRVLSWYERNRRTAQRTISLTDVHILGPRMANEFRAGFFRNRNDTLAVAQLTNEQFGLKNPLAGIRPDLASFDIRGDRDAGDRFHFGTLEDNTLDVQNTFTYADTLSFSRHRHSFKLGGEFRRHQLNGNLQELKNGRKNLRSWHAFLTVGYVDPSDSNRARQISDTAVNFGETIRGYRMADYSMFFADDWKVTRNLTLNIGVRYEYFGFPYEVNGILNVYDYNAAVAANDPQVGFVMASNYKLTGAAATAGIRKASTRGIVPADRNNFMPRLGFAWSPLGGRRLVVRGGYGMFYERTTGAFANSLRQSAPFYQENQLNDLADYNIWPAGYPVFPIPKFNIGFSSGTPRLEGSNAPGTQFEAFESQMIDPALATPYIQQWSMNIQWEFKPSWMWEIGYTGTKGTKLLQIINANPPLDIDAIGGFLPRVGVPGGGFTGNYYTSTGSVFTNLKTPPATCNLLTSPSSCTIATELRARLLGFDEDEGVNELYSNSNSIYNALQTSLQKRFSKGYMFKANYTFSRSIDIFSDEGKYQAEHDQSRPYLNRGLSDFHRKHRLITSGTWDLPLRSSSRWLKGWSLSGIGTLQSGRPFSITDSTSSAFLFASTNPRPNLALGATHEDLVTKGSVTSRISNYLNRSAIVPSGAQFGNLGRNVVMGPDQRRVDLVASKVTKLAERKSLELRIEAFNAFNTVTFRNPDRNYTNASFGEITRTRGGPRVIQLGLKLKF
jgi:hypothetical protein